MSSTSKIAVVVTSIAAPNPVLEAIAQGCLEHGFTFICIGDEKSPSAFSLEGCDYYSLAAQRSLEFRFAKLCPTHHYARKNIGYLIAIAGGAEIIIETDDDNFPRDEFWRERSRVVQEPSLREAGWVNAYRYFSESALWPRGLPLDAVNVPLPDYNELQIETTDCPIQQGLADENPDVDAIYRLLFELPQNFRSDRRLVLQSGSWCPFNSQNTTWWSDAFPLLYLPAYCSFRMTDIWRSFVAQRLSWVHGWGILFHEPTVYQERNEHNLMRDFQDEVPGYLHNRTIGKILSDVKLSSKKDSLSVNLRAAYAALLGEKLIGDAETELLEAWLEDISALASTPQAAQS